MEEGAAVAAAVAAVGLAAGAPAAAAAAAAELAEEARWPEAAGRSCSNILSFRSWCLEGGGWECVLGGRSTEATESWEKPSADEGG